MQYPGIFCGVVVVVEGSGILRGPVLCNATSLCADPDSIVEVILSWLFFLTYGDSLRRRRESIVRVMQELGIIFFFCGDARDAAVVTRELGWRVCGRGVTQALVTGGQEDVFGLVELEIAQKVTPWFHRVYLFAAIVAALQQQNAVEGWEMVDASLDIGCYSVQEAREREALEYRKGYHELLR